MKFSALATFLAVFFKNISKPLWVAAFILVLSAYYQCFTKKAAKLRPFYKN